MDNISNTLYFVERIETFPRNDTKIYEMNYFNIVKLVNSPSLQGHYTNDGEKQIYLPDENFRLVRGTEQSFWMWPKKSFILKNDNAMTYLQDNCFRCDYQYVLDQTLIPKSVIDYSMIQYYDVESNTKFFIIVIAIKIDEIPDQKKFYSYFSPALLTRQLQDVSIENMRFLEYIANQMHYHYDEINNIRNKSCENAEVMKRINQSTLDYQFHRMIENPHFLNSKLYMYQRANLYWMIQRETSPEKFVVDPRRRVHWGPHDDFSLERSEIKFMKRKNIQQLIDCGDTTYINWLNGGCLCDDVGLGKTIQVLTLCFMVDSRNLIIVPNHLMDHWQTEYLKHFDLSKTELVVGISSIRRSDYQTVLISFDDYKSNSGFVNSVVWTRVIIDEFHETMSPKIDIYKTIVGSSNVAGCQAQYRWAITATPFISEKVLFDIFNYLAEKKLEDEKTVKLKKYLDVYSSMFRRNIKTTVANEVRLPKVFETLYYFKMSHQEKLMYSTITTKKDQSLTTAQLQFCVNPSIFFLENFTKETIQKDFVSLDNLESNVRNMHKEAYDEKIREIINQKKEILVNANIITRERSFIISDDDLCELWEKNKTKTLIASHHHQIDDLENQLTQIKSKMTYFDSQIKLIVKATKKDGSSGAGGDDEVAATPSSSDDYATIENTECGVCMDELSIESSFLECGHIFCTSCINLLVQEGHNKCPMCKVSLRDTKIYSITKTKKMTNDFVEMVNKYGTKIAHLINLLNGRITDRKVLIYCHSPSLITNLETILHSNSITTCNITDLKKFKTNDARVLILSSDFNASGIELTYIKTIILLQTIEGSYMFRKQIENQIIGRLHRIGQTSEINFIRMIMNDTIEQSYQLENIMNDGKYHFSLETDKTEVH